jgi:hypothetical protein
VVLQLGVGLTTRHRKKKPVCHEMLHRASDLDGLFAPTPATENRRKIGNVGDAGAMDVMRLRLGTEALVNTVMNCRVP